VLEYAENLLTHKKYPDCANIVSNFKLHDSISSIKDLLTHLIYANDIPHIKKIANSHPDIKYKKLIIDLMCSNDYAKKAAHLLKEYNLSIFDFPHLIVRLQKKTIRYYLNALFSTKPHEKMSLIQIMELIEGYKSVQILIVGDLVYMKKFEEAFIIANYYDIWAFLPIEDTKILQMNIKNPEEIMKKFKEETADTFGPLTEGAFKMPCKVEDVIFVQDDAGVEKAKELLKADMVGIDSEWRPALMTFVNSRPAILQISSEKTYCIFDLLKLDGNMNFSELIKSLFMSMSILKLGLALKDDMRLICQKFPKMLCFHNMFNVIDVGDFYKERNPNEKQSSLATITDKLLCIF